jgi:predicted DNA-binding transcriptional regulator AlpA
MPRQAVRVRRVAEILDLTENQIYKLVRRREDPLPFKKIGKVLLFDTQKVWKWFDRQPGRDGDSLESF